MSAPFVIHVPVSGRVAGLFACCLLVVSACRPLTAAPEGCAEGSSAEACEPQPPPGTARVRIVDPPLPTDPALAPLSGRYLAVTVEVESAQAAREVELLCGSRRLATWSIPPDQETTRAAALLDLLPCWDPVLGAAANPLPVQLTVAVLDLLGARHGIEAVHLRVDFSREEGLLGLDAGIGDLSRPPTLELTLPAKIVVGAEGLLTVTSDVALAGPPTVEIDGIPVPTRAVGVQAWAAQMPALPLGIDAPGGDLDQLRREVPVSVTARGFGGQHARLQSWFDLHRELRIIRLPGPFQLAGGTLDPVLTNEGLAMLLRADSGEFGDSDRLGRVQADGRVDQVTLDGRSLGFDLADPLGFNAQGRLLVREKGTQVLRMQTAPIGQGTTSISQLLSAPIAGPRSGRWAAAGAEFLCTEELPPDTSCAPHVADRLCVDGQGRLARETPSGAGSLSTDGSEVAGGSEVFVSYAHQTCSGLAPPALGIGDPAGGHRWLDAAALPLNPQLLVWALPSGAGAVVLGLDSAGGTAEAWRVGIDGSVARYPLDKAQGLGAPLAAHPDGSLLILGDLGTRLWSFRPGPDAPPEVSSLRGVYAVPSEFRVGQDAVPLPDGGTALLLREAGDLSVLVVDAARQERWRWRQAPADGGTELESPVLRLSPDGRQLWLIDPATQRITILGV